MRCRSSSSGSAAKRNRVDWVRPDGGAMCCIRLRPDTFDDPAVQRFWAALPELDLQLGVGEWFAESARIARLGFGYLPLDRLAPALDQLTHALDLAERPMDAVGPTSC